VHPPTRTLLVALVMLAGCSEGAGEPEPLIVHLDERLLLRGRVREAIASPTTGEVYVELELSGGERRWVVLDAGAGRHVHPGAPLRVRSLARRSHVWVPALEREFASLDYAARH
jgi:hypothetical protein